MKKICILTFVFSIFYNLVLGQWQSVSQLNNGVSTPYVNFLNDQYIKRVGIGVVGLAGQAYSSQNNQTIPDPNFILDLGNYWIAGNTQPNTIPEGLGVSLIRNNYKQFDKNLQILGDISKTNASTITLCPSPTISPNDEYGSIYLMSHKSTATSASNSGRVTIGCKNNWTFTLTVDGYQDKVIIGNGLRATPAKWSSTNYKLFVEKGIMTEAVKIANINSSNWSDFVFDKNYILKPIEEVEKFINVNKHLPDVPSAREVSETGIELAKMDATLLQKIEELQLYIIQLNKRINTLELNAENK